MQPLADCVIVPCSVLRYLPAAANLVQDSGLLGPAKTEKKQRPQIGPKASYPILSLSTAHCSSPMLHVCRLGRAIALDKLIQEAALMALQALNLKRLQETPKNSNKQTATNSKKQEETATNSSKPQRPVAEKAEQQRLVKVNCKRAKPNSAK